MVNVIIVDDDKDTLDVMSKFLEINGVKVLGRGTNGKEAYELYQRLKPDIVITDMKMPEYDGVYGIKLIKKYNPTAKIIVISGYPNYNFPEVSAVFSKPYNIYELVEKINMINESLTSKINSF